MWFNRRKVPSYEDLIEQISQDISQCYDALEDLHNECRTKADDHLWLRFIAEPELVKMRRELDGAYSARIKAQDKNIHGVLNELESGGISHFGGSYYIAKAIVNEHKL
jgi:hypothetical protein